MNAVVKIQNTGSMVLAISEQELVEVLRTSLYPGAAENSIKMVISYCKASNLDPMQKPVHIVPMWDNKAGTMRDVIMPGVGLYRTQAARSGKLAGVSEPEFGQDKTEKIGGVEITYPEWCKVTVKRELDSGKIVEFTAVERWKENYAVKGGKEKSIAPNAMWCKRPYGQIAKCAQAQAFRIGFPESGSAPTADEMEGKALDEYAVGSTIDQETGEVNGKRESPRPELQPYSHNDFQTNLPAWEKAIETGKTTPNRIIAMVSSKYILSDDQKTQINGIKKVDGGMSEEEKQAALIRERAETQREPGEEG